jgi:hypothetical protein
MVVEIKGGTTSGLEVKGYRGKDIEGYWWQAKPLENHEVEKEEGQ